jgi:hypothetical protein
LIDTKWDELNTEYIRHRDRLKKYREEIKAEEAKDKDRQNMKKLEALRKKNVEYSHKAFVSGLYVDAREAELKRNPKEAKRLRSWAREQEQEWTKNHPAPKSLGTRILSKGPQPTLGPKPRPAFGS